jgi:hypothetical protein
MSPFRAGGGRSGPFPGPFESLEMGKIQEADTRGGGWVYNEPVRKAKTEIPVNIAAVEITIWVFGDGFLARRRPHRGR